MPHLVTKKWGKLKFSLFCPPPHFQKLRQNAILTAKTAFSDFRRAIQIRLYNKNNKKCYGGTITVYSVLVCDVVGSKRVKDRASLQYRLKALVNHLNRTTSPRVLAAITRGDEFEVMYRTPLEAYFAFEIAERKLYPQPVHGGIGVGEVTTKMSRQIGELDGPAFHRARLAVKSVRGPGSRILLMRNGAESRLRTNLNLILDLMWSIRSMWTPRQREFAEFYIKCGSPSQSEVARHFGVSQPAVSKVLRASNVRAVVCAREAIVQELRKIGGGG